MTATDHRTGLLQLLAIRDGTAPPAPIQQSLGFDLVEVTEGTAAFRYRPDARHLNPLGTIHGGVAMTLLDSAAGAAVHSRRRRRRHRLSRRVRGPEARGAREF